MIDSWSDIEVELIVADYFGMLISEINGLNVNKTGHRNKLLPLLNNRSSGSIEFKHQNISAVLIHLGQPYIKGYLPRFNYQKILKEKVIEYLNRNLQIENHFKLFADKDVSAGKVNFEKLLVEPPVLQIISEPLVFYHRNPIKINYIEKEQQNSKLGESGEKLAYDYEKWDLVRKGYHKLAEQVRWVSKDEGDGAGFDILSKNLNGKDKYIEVKTTKLSKEAPFFFSKNEMDFSKNHSDNYNLFRFFNFDKDARLFIKTGSLDKICNSEAVTFKGYFG